MSLDLQDKVIVVTGGGGGLGRELCKHFADEGAYVIAADLDLQAAEQTVDQLDGKNPGLAALLDVTRQDSWEALREQLKQKFNEGVDGLCNNAGIFRVGPYDVIELEDWYIQSRVNIDGVVLGCRTFGPDMAAKGAGFILNTASLIGLLAASEFSAYAASKFAVVGYSMAVGYELADKGVQVSILCPGAIDTPLNEGVEIPFEDRMIPPADVARHVVKAIKAGDGRQFIFTHAEFRDTLEEQYKAILSEYESFNTVPVSNE